MPNIKNIIKGTCSKITPYLLAGAALFGGNANAQDIKPDEENSGIEQKIDRNRTFTFDLNKDFLRDFDSNTHATHEINLVFEKGIEELLDTSLMKSGRGLITFLSFAANWYSTYASHEIAHGYVDRRNGLDLGLEFDIDRWNFGMPSIKKHLGGIVLPIEAPKFPFHYDRIEYNSEKDLIDNTNVNLYDLTEFSFFNGAGIVQNELNSEFIFMNNLLNGKQTLMDDMGLFTNKFLDTLYSTAFAEYAPGDVSEYVLHGLREYYSKDGENYTEEITDEYGNKTIKSSLFKKRHQYKPGDYPAFAMLADLLSYSTWESITNVADFIKNGNYVHNNDDKTLVPPNFSLYPTYKGLYLNMILPIRNLGSKKDNTILFFNLGTGVDTFGYPGYARNIRFGIDLRTKDEDKELSAKLFYNMDTKGNFTGMYLGYDFAINAGDYQFYGNFKWSHDDFIHNVVKKMPNDIELKLGLRVRY